MLPGARSKWLAVFVALCAGFAASGAIAGSAEAAVISNQPVKQSSVHASDAFLDTDGYSLVASDGGIFTYGQSNFDGSAGGMHLNSPIVGTAATPDGQGYWMVASDGGIFAYGDAGFYGSAGGMHLNSPIVGMASTFSGDGYWLVASDGGIFAYGDATFEGSAGGMHLNSPIVGLAATPDGSGYWLVASDGGIFGEGDATFEGSAGGMHLNKSIVGMAATPLGHGYWAVDHCHYFLQGGQYVGDYCYRLDTSSGAPDPTLLDFYTYEGGGPLTNIVYQLDRSNPNYFSVRILDGSAIFNYVKFVRWPVSHTRVDFAAPLQLEVCTQPPVNGQCYWLTITQIEAYLAQQNAGQPTPIAAPLNTLPSAATLNAGGAAVEIGTSDAVGAMGLEWFQPDCVYTEGDVCYVNS